EASVHAECSGATPGDRDWRGRTQSGGGGEPGRAGEEVQRGVKPRQFVIGKFVIGNLKSAGCGFSFADYKSPIANSKQSFGTECCPKKVWLSRSGGCAAEAWRCLAPRGRPGRTGNPATR